MSPERAFDVETASRDAWKIFDQIEQKLQRVAGFVSSMAERAQQAGVPLTTKDFETIKPELLSALADLPAPVLGLGVHADVGLLVDAKYWMAWFERDGAGVREGEHDLNPDSDNFYDYALADWLTERARMSAQAHGPYIDVGGTGKYTITTSVPIRTDRDFVGVAAADIVLEDLERLLAPTLHSAGGRFALLNEERRVVASNDATRPVGTLLEITDDELIPSGNMGWAVLYEHEA